MNKKNTRIMEAISMFLFLLLGIGLPIILTYEKAYYIDIESDKGFKKYKLPGDGTSDNPYIIENRTIIDQSKRGISIKNTTSYFIIRNCYISGNFFNGINLEFIANNTAKIYNNTCIGHSTGGINILSSNHIEIYNNTCFNNKYGISLINSYNCQVYSNYLYTTYQLSGPYARTYIGIFVENSLNLNIVDNYIEKVTQGILLERGNSSILSSNYIDFVARTAVGLTSSSYCQIINTTSNHALFHGFHFYKSNQNTIFNSTAINNNYGIYIRESNQNQILNSSINANRMGLYVLTNSNETFISFNNFCNNELQAVKLEGSATHTITHHNSFINNNLENSSQASDDGKNNVWYDEYILEGNYWSGWNSTLPYIIEGNANKTDPYPLIEPIF